ncbi:MAG: hypothetical protein Q8934_09005 [Bacillota bacterium]|nr:hypothetical protein [Bacillota bacterium]
MSEYEILLFLTPRQYEAILKLFGSESEFVRFYKVLASKAKNPYFWGPNGFVKNCLGIENKSIQIIKRKGGISFKRNKIRVAR